MVEEENEFKGMYLDIPLFNKVASEKRSRGPWLVVFI